MYGRERKYQQYSKKEVTELVEGARQTSKSVSVFVCLNQLCMESRRP